MSKPRFAESKPKKGNGGRKVSGEKRRKQNWMWLEQIYYKLDAQEIRIKTLEDKVKVLEELELEAARMLPEELKQHLKIHIDAISKSNLTKEKK